MDGAETDIGVGQCALCVNAQSGIIGNLEGYAVGLAHDQMSALGVECAVYLAQVLCFGAELCGLNFLKSNCGVLSVIVTLLLGLVINGKYAREYGLFTEIEHVVGVGAYLVETAGITYDAAFFTGLGGGTVNQGDETVGLTAYDLEFLLLENYACR